MNNEKIIENMRAVLKSTSKSKNRKKRHKKSSSNNNNNNNNDDQEQSSSADETISDLMSKNWKMKSPQGDNHQTTPKINAFEKLMKPKKNELTSPDTTIVAAQTKQKRKYTKKKNKSKETECEKIDTESDLSILDEESLIQMSKTIKNSPPLMGIQKFFGLKETQSLSCNARISSNNDNNEDDNKTTRKRNRGNEITSSVVRLVQEEKTPKRRRKVKENKMLLDSNENMQEDNEMEEDLNISQSARPRRSCANKVNYTLFHSSEKKSPEKKKVTRNKKNSNDDDDDEDEDFIALEIDENLPSKNKNQKPNHLDKNQKLAPVFVKKIPKPLLDPAVKEAQRNFLFSTELPSNIRASIDKQRQMEDEILSNELVAFPLVSHVTQLSLAKFSFNNVTMEESKIKIYDEDQDDYVEEVANFVLNCGQFTSCCQDEFLLPVICDEDSDIKSPIELKAEDVKASVRQIKDSSGNFPVNRLFKQLLKKHKNASLSSSEISFHNSLFIDVFRPSKFDEYLIASRPVEELKQFLTMWNDRNHKFDAYDSDSNSRGSLKGSSNSNSNYVVLSGGYGCGKTSSVYALANDLNYEVIEINAGSRRSGKKLLQDLYEATQSHRIEKRTDDVEQLQNNDTILDKRTIILIEDAEIAFDSDDGFISSIQQLINISKRPVILTTNSRSCLHLQKFMQYNEIIFENPTNSMIAKYLSLLSLTVASSHRHRQIDVVEIEQLYSLNEFDLRKTINEVEFFIRSEDNYACGIKGKRSSLIKFYERKKQSNVRRNLTVRNLNSSTSYSDFTFKQRKEEIENGGREISQHLSNLVNEISSFIAEYQEQDTKEVKTKSLIFDDLSMISSSGNVSTRAKAVDYSPLLRHICRSEKAREMTSRRTSRSHYLRFMIANNSFNSDYFNAQCEVFQQDEEK